SGCPGPHPPGACRGGRRRARGPRHCVHTPLGRDATRNKTSTTEVTSSIEVTSRGERCPPKLSLNRRTRCSTKATPSGSGTSPPPGGSARGSGDRANHRRPRLRPGRRPGPSLPAAAPRHPVAPRRDPRADRTGARLRRRRQSPAPAAGRPCQRGRDARPAEWRALRARDGGGLRFDGRYYHLSGVHAGPAPAHPIEIWIGANRPRALALTGRVADGWVSPLMNYKPPREAAEGNRTIDRAASEAGRDPREIRRIFLIPGAFTSTPGAPATDGDQAVVGPPEQWAEVLTHFATDLGFSTFVLVAPPDPETLTTYIELVAPRVRERVAERRAGA